MKTEFSVKKKKIMDLAYKLKKDKLLMEVPDTITYQLLALLTISNHSISITNLENPSLKKACKWMILSK